MSNDNVGPHPSGELALTGAILGALGGVAQIGWLAGWPAAVTLGLGGLPVACNSALAFALLGAGLLARAGKRSRLAQGAAGVVALVAAATLLEYLVGRNFGIDHPLVSDEFLRTMASSGRMHLNTTVTFLVCSWALLELTGPRPHSSRLATLGGVILTMAMLALFETLVGLPAESGWTYYTKMSVPTAAGFVVFSVMVLRWATRRSEGADVVSFLFVSAAALLVACAGMLVATNTELIRANGWVEHTIEVRGTINQFIATLARSERSVRD